MMKNNLLKFNGIFMLLLNLNACDNSQEKSSEENLSTQKAPATKIEFINVSDKYPELGSVVWRETATNRLWTAPVEGEGSLYFHAAHYCEAKGMRLPTSAEYRELLKLIGAQSDAGLGVDPKNYNPPTQSFLDWNSYPDKIKKLEYLWSSTEAPSDEGMTINYEVFSPKTGAIYTSSHRKPLAFLCTRNG